MDAKTRPPVAIYSSYRDDDNVLGLAGIESPAADIPARFACWYPLLAYSPEYVAMAAANYNFTQPTNAHVSIAYMGTTGMSDGTCPWGNDTMGGFLGTNTLNGEQGQDTFVVRQLSLNPTNDFDSTIDILMATTRLNEGGRPPAA